MSTIVSRRTALGCAAAASAAAILPCPAQAAGTIPRRSGLPWASGCFGNLDELALARARPLDVAHFYMTRNTFADIATAKGTRVMLPRAETVMISYPMWPNDLNPKLIPGLWARAANGEFDSYHRSSGAVMATYNRPIIFRIGWEWNNKGFPWACRDAVDIGAYQTYFQRIVTALRERNTCWIDWSSDKEGKTDSDIRLWYPGSAYVDFVGPNHYDFWPAIRTQTDWDRAYGVTRKGGPKGMGAWLAYAQSLGKPLSFGEWGLIPEDPNGGGDNPIFIQNMLWFFKNNAEAIAYESYFNYDTSTHRHRLTNNPLALAAYQRVLANIV